MSKSVMLILILLFCSCKTVIISPLNITYTGEIKEEGISITAKPPFWHYCVQFYRYCSED